MKYATQEEFNTHVLNALKSGDGRMNKMEMLLSENTKSTSRTEKNTAEMLDVFQSWKGAMRALEMIGKLAKPLSYILGVGAALVAFWTALKSGVPTK